MKKILLLLVLISSFLVGCTVTTTIPADATVAICVQTDTFKYVYKDSTVYEFYSNDVLQDDDMKSVVQTQVDAVGTVQEYIDQTFFTGSCTFSTYTPTSSEKG